MESSEFGSRKQPWTSESSPSNDTGRTSLRSISTSSFLSSRKRAKNDHSSNQMLLCKLNDPNAPALMDVAIADFLHSHCLPFSLADDKKLMRVVEVARTLGPNYNPPSRQDIGGKYLDALYQNSRKQHEDSDDDEQQVSICVSSLHWLKILTFDVVFIFYLLLL